MSTNINGHVRHLKIDVHQDGLLPYSPGLHHKDNATQQIQAAATSPCSWNPNRGPLQTFLRAGPLMSLVKDRAMANLRCTIRKLHAQASNGRCSVPTKRSLHAAIEARIDCLLVMLPSQHDGLFLHPLHISTNPLIPSNITTGRHAQCLTVMGRSELHGIVSLTGLPLQSRQASAPKKLGGKRWALR
jgi:hypothetical protein